MITIRYYYILFLFTFSVSSFIAQTTIPFVDFNNYFQSFQDESVRMIELQRILDYKVGDEFVSYIDNRGNLRLFDGEEVKDITNLNVEYQVSDHLMTWKVGPTLNLWDNGKQQTLTFNARNYQVRDSIVVFEDLRYNAVKVYYDGKVYDLYSVVSELSLPIYVGENIVAFKDNGDFYKVFWRGKVYDLGVWNGTIEFQGGTDVLTFNDPTMRTFAVFEQGEFLDVEKFFMHKYKAGRGFIVYEDLNNNLIYYAQGEKKSLTYFSAKFWRVVDDIVVWEENGFVYAFFKGQKYEVCNFIPEDFQLKNGTFAFKNVVGGISIFVEGKTIELTNQEVQSYHIYGNSVIVQLFNNAYVIYSNGKIHKI